MSLPRAYYIHIHTRIKKPPCHAPSIYDAPSSAMGDVINKCKYAAARDKVALKGGLVKRHPGEEVVASWPISPHDHGGSNVTFRIDSKVTQRERKMLFEKRHMTRQY